MSEITFARLTDINPVEIMDHMNDPRMAEHMPLLTPGWDEEAVAKFVSAKEAGWSRDGLGHWAFLSDGSYVGWGGFELTDGEWDFGLVLKPSRFGLGPQIARKAIDFARQDERIGYLVFLLAPTRRSVGALRRIGARALGETRFADQVFLKYRLDTPQSGAAERA